MRYWLIGIFSVFIICVTVSAADSTQTESRFLNWLKGNPKSPYRLSWPLDLSISATSVSLQLLSRAIDPNFIEYTAKDLTQFSKNDVNAFDRSAIGPINDNLEIWSYLTNGLATHFIWLLLFGKEGRSDFTKVLVMYAQAYVIIPIFTQWTQPLVARKRPYFYSDEEDIDTRLSTRAQTSFISGHANYGFCFAVLFANLFSDYYPDSPFRYVVWPLCLGTASATCLLRYAGHQHYPTDLLAGALTGSFVGWFVPFMHKKKEGKKRVTIEPVIGSDVGLRLTLYGFYL